MKRKYHILSIIISAALLAGCLSACGESGTIGGSSSDENTAATVTGGDAATTPDTTADVEAPDVSGATTIALSGQSATATGTGAEVTDGMVTITAGGTYVVTGTMTEGRILVNAPKEEVTLVLQDAAITCSTGSPLYVYKSKATTLYLPEGTASTLTDGTDYTFSDSYSSAEEEEPNACLYSKSDLVIAGSGSLTVNANYNNGITGKDTLFIQKASVTVNAVNHGINGKDSLTIKDADITVTSGGDALRSTNDSDTTLGYLVITGSALKLTAGEDGIQAETTLTISGGTATVTTAGGAGQSISDDTSAKGLKAGTQVTVTGGTFQLNCCDDAIHSNGDVTISGGSFTIATGDDGMHADDTLSISSGTIDITRSYEGLEGAKVLISGGKISIVASDDGINAAGGSDQSGSGGFGFAPDSFGGSGDYLIRISGGVVTVNASGDGIDSNGDIEVTGGELYISGPTSNGDGTIDCDGSATITGGIVVAAGSTGMAENFGTASTQGSILVNLSGSAGQTITLKDSDGNILASFTPAKAFGCVVVSAPGVAQGGTYTIAAGGASTTVTMESLIYGSGMGGFGGMGGGMGGPVIIGDVPDLNQYRIEYNESVQHLETLANALAKVAGFPQESAAPGQTVATAAVAAAAAAATAPTDAVAEIKKYKDLLDSGIITEEEFTAKKKQLMGI